MAETHMFWAYGEFSRLERICVASFIKGGFDLKIWTYGEFENPILGAEIRDARQLVPEDQIFRNRSGSYASFSDLFRYTILTKIGGLYVDTDVYALKHADELPKEKFLVTERLPKGGLQANNNVIFEPEVSRGSLVDLALAVAERFPRKDITWGELGPTLLTALARAYRMHGYRVYEPEFANAFDPWECPQALTAPIPPEVPEKAFFLHFYSDMWRRRNIEKNARFHPDSLYETYARRVGY
ncbi:MAG: glycosyltransferase [Alphaproteobacteria bacterium]|jgi:hypothetical protein